jgi:catechol 2,3-dioxygenase-like lactoylglutathione lyase family enzyme
MKIKVTSVYVDDQEKALRFYTEVLGFAKKADFSQGPFRWLTVTSPEDPDGTELQLALNDDPRLRPTSRPGSRVASWRPCSSPTTSRATASASTRGGELTMPPTEVTG